MIYDGKSELRSNIVVDQTFRRILNEEFAFDLDISSEYFDPPSSPAEDFPLLVSWLQRKYSGRTFDVVVPINATGLQFVREYGQELFRGSQIVYWGRKAALDTWGSGSPLTGVVAPEMGSQIRGTFSFIRALQPDLQRLIVVTGVSPKDQAWEAVARRELSPFEGAIGISFLAGLPLEDVEARLSHLPSRTAVLLLTINEDGTGRRLLRTQYSSEIVQKASAPVYSTSSVYLDTGIVGGALLNQETMAIEAAGLVVRLLRGEDVTHMPVLESPLSPTVNWPAMRRWQLNEDRLPPGTTIMNRPPSIWDVYRWHIIGILSLCVLEAGLIVALLIQRANRRQAEKATRVSKQLLQSTIDALNARVALVDQNGTIIAVNRRWQSFAEANGNGVIDNGKGFNYFKATASGSEREEAQLISDGIARIKSGELEEFRCIYPAAKHSGASWFQVRVNRFEMDGVLRFVVTYEDVTEIRKAHDAQQQLTGLLMLAQDEERRRIARDLHDVTVQNMVAIKADLAYVERSARSLERGAEEMLQESVSLCDQVIKELRTLSYLLHPPFLDEAGLVPALKWFVRGFIQRSGVQVELQVADDVGRLPTEIETALFRVVQESLTNIHRHSGSKRAIIGVVKDRDAIIVRVTDEGHGFLLPTSGDGQDGLSSGVGIQSMHQRLKQLGGQLEIESSSEGTHVKARISISEDRHAAHISG